MSEDKTQVEFNGTLDDLGDMSGVSTKYPLIEPGLVTLRIVSFKQNEKEKEGKVQKSLVVELETVNNEKEFEKPDSTIGAGHKLRNNILLTESGKWTLESSKKALATLMEAALGNHDGAFNTEALLGKEVIAKVGVRQSDEFGDSNEIKRFLPQG